MLELIGADTQVSVYSINVNTDSYFRYQELYSFGLSARTMVPYAQFLQAFKSEKFPGMVVMKDDTRENGIAAKLLQDVIIPPFYHDISELEGVEIMQGSHFIDKPHYEKKEQIMCLLDGHMDIILVPHIYRQEVYAGDQLTGSIYDEVEMGRL